MEKIVKDSQSPAANHERTGCELVNKLWISTSSKSWTQWRLSSPRSSRRPCRDRIRSSMRRSITWVNKMGTRSRTSHIWQVSCCANRDIKPRSSRQYRIRSLDPTTIRQAKINQFDKHFEILEEQCIDKEIDVPVMLQRKVPTTRTLHREQWRCTKCSLSTQTTTIHRWRQARRTGTAQWQCPGDVSCSSHDSEDAEDGGNHPSSAHQQGDGGSSGTAHWWGCRSPWDNAEIPWSKKLRMHKRLD